MGHFSFGGYTPCQDGGTREGPRGRILPLAGHTKSVFKIKEWKNVGGELGEEVDSLPENKGGGKARKKSIGRMGNRQERGSIKKCARAARKGRAMGGVFLNPACAEGSLHPVAKKVMISILTFFQVARILPFNATPA